MVEADHGEAARAQHPANLVDGRLRVGGVVEDAEGVDRVERAVGEWQALRVGAHQPGDEALEREAAARQLQVSDREVDSEGARAGAGELEVVRAQAGADLERAQAGERGEVDRVFQPRGVGLVSFLLDRPEELGAARLEAGRRGGAARVGVSMASGSRACRRGSPSPAQSHMPRVPCATAPLAPGTPRGVAAE